MNGQNRLTETYLPDKATRKEKILVGISGGIDSLVTAYLLKIQKYELIAVTVVPSWEEGGKDHESLLSCTISGKKIESIQAFCHQLGITHHIVRIPREFREVVIEKWMSKKAAGEYPDQCWSCHALRIQFLHDKMKELGAKNLATGHFAKIYRQDPESATLVQTSNDEQFDQSALLSRLPQEILKDLMLPLSDLQKKEVLKLAENFGVNETIRNVQMFDCFPENEETIEFLMTKLPERFRKEGSLNGDNDERLGDHEGVVKFRKGNVALTDENRKSLYFTKYTLADRKIHLGPLEWFTREKLVLRNCTIPTETPWSGPFRGVLMKNGNSYEGWFYPKTLSSCEAHLDVPLNLMEGEILCVVKKKGKNSRVLLSGVVKFIEEAISEGELNVQIDYSRDF